MPVFKLNLDIKNFEKMRSIAKNAFGDDSDYRISILLNRYLRGIN